jgi:hypothetical protein
MRTSTHPVQIIRSNLRAMLMDGISGTISFACAPARDVHHLMLCALLFFVSENEHRHALNGGGSPRFLSSRE